MAVVPDLTALPRNFFAARGSDTGAATTAPTPSLQVSVSTRSTDPRGGVASQQLGEPAAGCPCPARCRQGLRRRVRPLWQSSRSRKGQNGRERPAMGLAQATTSERCNGAPDRKPLASAKAELRACAVNMRMVTLPYARHHTYYIIYSSSYAEQHTSCICTLKNYT